MVTTHLIIQAPQTRRPAQDSRGPRKLSALDNSTASYAWVLIDILQKKLAAGESVEPLMERIERILWPTEVAP